MFKKAERKKAKLRLALCGPSGSGKTYSALVIAKGLGGKVAMIDTEHGSGSLYANDEAKSESFNPEIPEYDTVELGAPYSPDRYINFIKKAEEMGYETLIIDSLSHAWTGEGGVLEMVDNVAKASNSKNSFTAWRDVTPKHNKLVEAILTSKMHVIVTMRTKVDYVMETNDKGKLTPRKIGLAPIQREGMDFEFTVVLDLSVDGHIASASKDRTRLFDGNPQKPAVKTGQMLVDWLNSGKSQEMILEEENKNFSLMLDSIEAAKTMDTLKEAYEKAKINYAADKAKLDDLIIAKDRKKTELTNLNTHH